MHFSLASLHKIAIISKISESKICVIHNLCNVEKNKSTAFCKHWQIPHRKSWKNLLFYVHNIIHKNFETVGNVFLNHQRNHTKHWSYTALIVYTIQAFSESHNHRGNNLAIADKKQRNSEGAGCVGGTIDLKDLYVFSMAVAQGLN